MNDQGVAQDAGVPNEGEYQAIEVIDVHAYAELQAAVEGLKQLVGE